jgi:F-type H+-transporting ATPase subunit b
MELIFLADFSPLKPDFGLLFWTTLIFLLVWIPIGRKAFKPILEALKSREQGIADALAAADNAKKEMANLKSENEQILAQAREERMKMLQDAKAEANRMVAESKENAKTEANKIMTSAKQEIENMKQAAMVEVKNQVGTMALEIAEKIIRKELKTDDAQIAFANTLAKEMNLN